MFRNRFRGAADSNAYTLQRLNDLLDKLKQGISNPSDTAQQALDESLNSSRFLIAKDGRPGLGPLDTQPGDRLALLIGGDVPHVLRRSLPRCMTAQLINYRICFATEMGHICYTTERWQTPIEDGWHRLRACVCGALCCPSVFPEPEDSSPICTMHRSPHIKLTANSQRSYLPNHS